VVAIMWICSLLGMIAAGFFAKSVMSVSIEQGTAEEISRFKSISGAISDGATAFLKREFSYVGIFVIAFAGFILFALDESSTPLNEGKYSAIAFLAGALTSVVSAIIGMKIATAGNVRTTVMARKSISEAFLVAFRSGAVMGFALCGLAVFGLLAMVSLYTGLVDDPYVVMELVAGFGLGGSTVALFGRVGGGIFTKAADVGADLVGKVEAGIPEDDPRNPAVIADNVGDNVGDIAGMGSDLFGSCAEATCAALVIGATSTQITGSETALLYPILISAVGIPVCLVTSFFARLDPNSTSAEPTLKRQLVISTILMTIVGWWITKEAMVDSFTLGSAIFDGPAGDLISQNDVFVCLATGLWAGLIIGVITEYFTSHTYSPVRKVAEASETGAASNIIFGMALGYESSVIPVIAIAITTFISWELAGMYGIAIAALGMISTMAIGLTIDAYGPVSDNAGGIAEMAKLEKEVRNRTDLLDAAGNTTAAIGKGFAIGSAVLTALALFGAFLTRAGITSLDLLTPMVFAGALVGGTLPFLFTAWTMRAVGVAAQEMIVEVRHQFKTIPGLLEGTGTADYARCVSISTAASLKQMVAPGMLVMATPLLCGYLLGAEALAGLLAGSLISGVVMALSSSNAGGAWDNAKKYIETGKLGGKGSETHKAAVVGDTVGDPMKDTSGPSLNILMKLMAILSLVFASFFAQHGGVLLGLFN
jgi:K(+)-stimulated pyrophosphate-energized sodium pump